jgi:quinol monooxygenase YgiN
MNQFYRSAVAAATLAVIAAPAPAPAQVSSDPTLYAVTYIEVMPSAQAQVAGLLKEVAAASREEAGNRRYDVLQRIDRPNQFAMLEAWSDMTAAQGHAGGTAMKQFRAMLKPLQTAPYDERPSVGVAVSSAPPPPAAKGSIYVITHVDVTPANKDDCVLLLKKLGEDTRKEANSERFEAWQQNNRSNHFTVTEVWKNRPAIDAHIVAASTREFREKLGPMAGALYDERLYQNIE